MDPNLLFTFGIPAAVVGSWLYRKFFRGAASKAAPRGKETASQAEIAQAIETATEEAPVATRQWLDYVNRLPDTVPHLAVVGPSGAGKTTFTTAVLGDRTGQIVIITAKEGDDWGNLPYIGIDSDATYTTANNTFKALDAEVRRRLVSVKERRMTADWLTVCLDDYSTLRKVCDAADEPFKLIARLGRSLRVRLVVLSDSEQVKAWGIEGEGATRQHFAFIRLQRGHRGTLEVDGKELPIDTSLVRQLAQRANLSNRGWHAPRDRDAELSDLLDTNIAGGFGPLDTDIDTNIKSGIPGMDAVNRGISNDTGINDRDAAILAIMRANPEVSKNSIYAAVGGNRNHIFSRIDELRRITG